MPKICFLLVHSLDFPDSQVVLYNVFRGENYGKIKRYHH